MKHHNNTFKLNLAVTVCATSLALFQSQAFAAPGTLSDQPLYVGPAVESNIFMLSDDSGSMDWEVMTTDTVHSGRFTAKHPDGTNPADASGSVTHRSGCTFSDAYSSDGYIYIVKFASNSYSDASDCYTAADTAWRPRNSDFNPMYFDPTKTYLPWDGVDSSGNDFANISITNAPDEPYDPQHTINLLTQNSVGAVDNIGFRFYTWTDSDSDGYFDDGEETEYKIKDVTDGQAVTWLGAGATAADVKQNFANWFSYHRKREYVAKYALSKATSGLTGVRIGYGTINNNANNKIELASMNLEPDVGNKKAMFDMLYKTNSNNSTPLRQNLEKVGKYFDYVNGSFFGDTGSYNDPILSAAEYGMCQKNVTILTTDGFYNGSDPGVGDADGDNNTSFDGGNYDKDATNASNTLADVAMHYYENDLSALNNEVTPTSTDTATHQHMNTFTVAFGVTGTLDPFGTKTPADATDTDPTDAGFVWPAPTTDEKKIDDLWHAAYNGRGDFFSAQNPDALVTSIQSAINTAAKGSSSAAAVAFNTTTLDTGSVVYQAKFNPSEDWKGELTSTDLNADGSIASVPNWNAGDVMNTQTNSSRIVFTYKRDAVTPSNSTGVAFKTLADLSASQQADLNMGPAAADAQGQARIDYLRGDTSNESTGLSFRDRTNVLGDIVHSNPVYVGKPQSGFPDSATFGDGLYSTYKTNNASRNGIVYVGSNDGMLHGLDETTGQAKISYVPNSVFSSASGEGLHYLTDPNYSHKYYVDLSPTVSDMYYDANSNGSADAGDAWKTVLIGGLRAGGRGLFALDITNPTNFTDANASNIVLWEFDSSDDSDLGYTYSKPTISLLENGRWAAVFGNGYNSSGDGEAKLFIVYIDRPHDGTWTLNTDYLKISTEVGTLADLNGLSTPAVVDTNGDGRGDRVYAGDLKGNLWAFDIGGSNTAQWGVAYKQGSTPKPLFTAFDSGSNPQPITSKPIVANQTATVTGSPSPNLMIFFGTGQFIVDGDKTTTSTQSFYGVWDDGTKELDRTDLTHQKLLNSADGTKRTTTDPATAVAYDNSHKGWFHDLPGYNADGTSALAANRERVVVNPKVRGNYVFYNTLIPGSELCSPQGSGWLMAVKQSDGSMSDERIFDTDGDGDIDSNDAQVSGIKLENIPAGSNFLGDVMYTPDDEGNVDARKVNAGISEDSGRLSWQELYQD